MTFCQKDACKHLVPIKDTFDGQEFVIGFKCEEGFAVEANEERGYARMSPNCEKYERRAE